MASVRETAVLSSEAVLQLCEQSQSMIDITAKTLFALRKQLQYRATEELIRNEILESEVCDSSS